MEAVGGGTVVSLAGCLGDASSDGDGGAIAGDSLTLATATTAYDSGLLDALNPGFEDRFGVSVEAIARGTGGSLETARNGDCDVVLVHARPLEDEFLRAGHGINRRSLMANDFLVVGPPDDPAGIAGRDPVSAFEAIAEAEATFVSRGDRSGTHIREREIWEETGVSPSGSWYSETGQGMGNTLVTAAQTNAYTLTDRGTFLNVVDGGLVAHVDRGIRNPPPLLRNEYGVIPVNPAGNDTEYQLAMAYVGYVTGPGQDRIEEFRIDGSRAFRPAGVTREPDFEQYVPSGWRR